MRCASCPFKTKCITGKGPKDSPFVIVGESPGSRELVAGIPFVGPSGQMLDAILKRVGFDSLGIKPYVINALNCYPAAKDIAKMQTAARACQSRVLEEIKAHPRKVILTLGAAASWSVTNDFDLKITMARGRVIQKPELCSEGVVLAVHPAFLMRNGTGLPMWQKDLKQAVDLLRGIKLGQWSEPTWRVIERPSEYNEVVEEYTASDVEMITGDVETDAFHFMDGRMLCLGITKGDGSHVDIIPEHLLYSQGKTTKRLMEANEGETLWNWHNGLFDIKWFRRHGIKARVDEDTMLLSYAGNENAGYHDLDQVAQQWIGAPRHKHMLPKLPKGESYRSYDKPLLYKYNAIDLSKTHCAHKPMSESIDADPNLQRLYNHLLIPAVDFVAEMQLYGVEVDEVQIWRNASEHAKLLEEINERIQPFAEKHMGHRINVGSPKQLKELLYGKMGYGRISMSTDEAALEEIARNYDMPPIVNHIMDYREVAKRRSTYVMALVDHEKKLASQKKPVFVKGKIKSDGRIHADFKLHGTSTGRLAGAEPNLLNQPRGPIVRSQYVAAKGKIFVEVDLNQAELRSLTIMSGDPVLTEIYTKNEVSIHDVTTGAFYAPKELVLLGGEECAKVRHMLHLGDSIPAKEVYGEAKMRGKAVNFGIVYGREAFSLAKEFNIPVAEAQRWIDTWLGTYCGAAEFIEWCRRAPLEKRTLITVFGRKKRWGVVSNENLRGLMNEAANFPHQSTASDIMLETAIEVSPVLRRRWDAHIWNEVYDAIYFEIEAEDDRVIEAIQHVQKVITEVPLRYGLTRVPFIGDAKIGYNWGHMKDFDPTKNKIVEILGERP